LPQDEYVDGIRVIRVWSYLAANAGTVRRIVNYVSYMVSSVFRKLVRANYKSIDRDVLRDLADQVWQGGGEEILQFVEIAMQDKPFPI
jgi:hypothetical protein